MAAPDLEDCTDLPANHPVPSAMTCLRPPSASNRGTPASLAGRGDGLINGGVPEHPDMGPVQHPCHRGG